MDNPYLEEAAPPLIWVGDRGVFLPRSETKIRSKYLNPYKDIFNDFHDNVSIREKIAQSNKSKLSSTLSSYVQ